MTDALDISTVSIEFGGLKAVNQFTYSVPPKSIYGLIGPNGAGKTTIFNLLTGVYRPTNGKIHAFGKELTGLAPHEVQRLGVARTFQNIRLFKELSVLDNLLVAIDNDPEEKTHGILSSCLRTKPVMKQEATKRKQALGLLKEFQLETRAGEEAQNLPYGSQRRLEIARAMASGAKILLLDEPAAGMNPQETAALMELIRSLREKYGLTILLIEHDMRLVMGVCERIAVVDYGVKIAEGAPKEIQCNPKVLEAYLGKKADHA